MKMTIKQLRKIINEALWMDNVSLTREDADLAKIAEYFGYHKTNRENVIQQSGAELEPLRPNEYEIIDPPQENGLRLHTSDFSVSKYHAVGKWMYAVRMNGRSGYLGPMRTIDQAIKYIGSKL